MKEYYVYILTNISDTVYYTGVTNNIVRRAYEHKNKLNDSYTKKYNLTMLVYYEVYNDINFAIEREKKIKKWSRKKKRSVIMEFNVEYKDLWNDVIRK